MKKKQIIDITGTPLTPSKQGRECLGNGEHSEYECCCDECDYFLYCFDQYEESNRFLKSVKNLLHTKKHIIAKGSIPSAYQKTVFGFFAEHGFFVSCYFAAGSYFALYIS